MLDGGENGEELLWLMVKACGRLSRSFSHTDGVISSTGGGGDHQCFEGELVFVRQYPNPRFAILHNATHCSLWVRASCFFTTQGCSLHSSLLQSPYLCTLSVLGRPIAAIFLSLIVSLLIYSWRACYGAVSFSSLVVDWGNRSKSDTAH